MESIISDNADATRATPFAIIQERRFLKNVTSKTLAWYQDTFKAFAGLLDCEVAIEHRIWGGG